MDTLSSNTPQNKPSRKRKNNTRVTLQCVYCHNDYTLPESHANRTKTHYCSKECYKADNDKRVSKQCAFCGKNLLIKQCLVREKNYCSPLCRSKDQQKQESIACLNCGVTFEDSPSSKRKFCSHDCARSYRVGPRMHNYKGNMVDCTCLFCGASFQKPEAWVNKGEGRFCSGTCRSSFTMQKQGGMVSSIEIAVKGVLDRLGENYYHQHRIGRFLVDFYLPDRNLVIEADGEYWHSLERSKRRDLKKDQYMKGNNINLARLKESDILSFCEDLVKTTLSHFPKQKENHLADC